LLGRVKITKVTYPGILVAVLMIVGVFGPWLTLSYDPDSRIDPVTKIGERIYHSRIELSPFMGSLSRDGVVVEESWLISPGTAIGGVIILFASLMAIFRYRKIWVHFVLFLTSVLGFVSFFMSLGRGIAIGVITQIGWGMWLSGLGVMMLFVVSIREMSKNSISRFVD
jgi:hypothetical protein